MEQPAQMLSPRPFLLDRKMLPKVWGGRALESLFGFPLPPGESIGETWELYDRPEGSSRLRGTDQTLRQWMEQDPEQLLGRGVPAGHGGRFPLLLKFLDAREALSLQVHPDDAEASTSGDSGKSEALLVLQAGPRARLVHGLKAGVDRSTFERLGHRAEVEGLLHTFRPKVGDCVFVPAGTVHATGPDVVALEIQQNSDLTYRLYDWGRDREVHVQKAHGVTRFDDAAARGAGWPVEPGRPLADGGRLLVASPWFRVRRYDLGAPISLATQWRYMAVTVLGGRGSLRAADAAPLPLLPGDTVLVPATVTGFALVPDGRLDVVVCDPGEI